MYSFPFMMTLEDHFRDNRNSHVTVLKIAFFRLGDPHGCLWGGGLQSAPEANAIAFKAGALTLTV